MELSNIEIGIIVKNVAREMVKKATAKNAYYIVEYVEGGVKKQERFSDELAADRWAQLGGLKRSKDPKKENEYRIVR